MKKNSFMEGTIIATAIIVIIKILGMLYVIPFYAIIGSDGGALYSYAYNIYLIFLGISSAGLPAAISKIISEYNALGLNDAKARAYNIGKKIIGIISVIAFIILFVFAPEIGYFIIGNLNGANNASDVAFVIRCISPSILLIPYLSIMKGYLQGHNFIEPSSISQLIEQVVRIIVILVGSYLVLNVIKGSLSASVGIATTGAFFGGLAALIYLKIKMKKCRVEENTTKKDKLTNKEIAKTIIRYAVPSIIINVVNYIYNFTDQILVLRTLEAMKFNPHEVEFVASAISTWSPKICMIINAMAMGMTMSLIPTIASSVAVNDKKAVEININKSICMILFISLPLSIGLSILAPFVWTIFYNTNNYGWIVLRYASFSALLGNVYLVISTISQSLSKYKLVYIISIVGSLVNALLDVPLMYLFKFIGNTPFVGSIASSMVSYVLIIVIALHVIKKENNINYEYLYKNMIKMFIPSITMALILFIVNIFIPFNDLTRFSSLIKVIINVIIGGIVYIGLSLKMNLVNDIVGEEYVNKIIKKLTLGKFGR